MSILDPNTAKIELIIALISQFSGVPEAEIRGKCRRREYVDARHFAMYTIRTQLGASLPAIGRAFGVHHKAVIHAVNRVSDLTLKPSLTITKPKS